MLGKLCITTSFAIIYFWSAELYPTVLRNSLLGVSSTMARLGTVFAPFIADMVSYLQVHVQSYIQSLLMCPWTPLRAFIYNSPSWAPTSPSFCLVLMLGWTILNPVLFCRVNFYRTLRIMGCHLWCLVLLWFLVAWRPRVCQRPLEEGSPRLWKKRTYSLTGDGLSHKI